ncbi:restriction endonuclease subunit S [Aeromonas caviae]
MVPKGWTHTTLGKVMVFKNGLNFTKADVGEEIKIVGVSDFKDLSELRSTERLESVNVASHIKDDELLTDGDLLFVRSNGNKDLIGRCLFFPEVKERLSFSGFTIRGRADKKNILPQYIAFVARSSFFKSQISQYGGGTNISNLSQQILNDIALPLPPHDEQKKIVQILSTWDKAIGTTEQLLANSQQLKKALMQQLLTGKKRLGIPDKSYEFQKTRYGIIPKDWEYPAIKDICTQVTQKNTVSAGYPVLSCSKYDGFVDSLKYFKKKVYSDDTSGYRLIHRGCFGFPSNHVEEGSIGLQNLYDTGIVSPIYVVFRAKTKRVDNDYLYAVLKTDHYRQIFGAATNASVDRRGSLRWKEFSLIHVPLPPLDEQQKIAAVLSTSDKEITALQQKLDALKQEKKALMQQLLTGKRRVKV